MEKHIKFTEWAVQQGVEINGIAADRFPGRGLGIVAEKNFKAKEILLTVPITALRTIQTVPKSISRPIGKITTHGLLAAELCLDNSSHRSSWRAVLPTREDIAESVPLMWDVPLQNLLPSAAKTLLANQKRKLKDDWLAVSKAFPEIQYEDYLYRWLLVNTRTFYYLDPKTKKKPARDDCMALNPFADYFNHSSYGCTVEFTSAGYTIATEEPIKKGDEIYISYGNHSNDFLLAEYGFIMDDNAWDEISLDSYILPRLSEKQSQELKDAGFLGKYMLDMETVCYRTQVVLRMLVLTLGKWRRFVNGGDDGEKEQLAVNKLLREVLEEYKEDVRDNLVKVGECEDEMESRREALRRRWEQIKQLLELALKRVE